MRLGLLIAGAVVLLAGALMIAGVSPAVALSTLAKGSLGSTAALSGTLRETTPLLIAGLAVFLALRAGLFNIGVEGQLIVGACAAAASARLLPGAAGIALAILAGIVAGAIWAWPAGWIRAYRNGHEVITTIMLNNIALFLTDYLVAGPLRDPSIETPTTRLIESRLPNLIDQPPLTVSFALLIGLLLAIAMTWWFRRTVKGYEFEAVGGNPVAARFAGIDARNVIVRAMTASGGIAGLAGALQVVAYEGRFYSGFSPGYGFDSLGVALLGGGNAVGVIPGSLLFGMLAKGSTSLQIEGVPKGITFVVLGLLVLIAGAIRYRKEPAID